MKKAEAPYGRGEVGVGKCAKNRIPFIRPLKKGLMEKFYVIVVLIRVRLEYHTNLMNGEIVRFAVVPKMFTSSNLSILMRPLKGFLGQPVQNFL